MKTHELKTWPMYFSKVASGQKTFEVRNNDRNFKEGDFVILKEFDFETKSYSGREMTFKIGYVLDTSQFFIYNTDKIEYVVFSLIPGTLHES